MAKTSYKLDIAISLALSGLDLDENQIELLQSTENSKLIDRGLSLNEIQLLRAQLKRLYQTKIAQHASFGDKSIALKALEHNKNSKGKIKESIDYDGMFNEFDANVSNLDSSGGRNLDYSHPEEGSMVKRSLHQIIKDAESLKSMLRSDDDIPQWCHNHVTRAEQLIGDTTAYLEYKILTKILDV